MFLAVFFVSKNGEKRDRKFLNKAKTIFIVSLKKGRKRMNKKHSKLITLLLVVAMLFTMTPMSAFATEKTAPEAEKTVADSAAPSADSTKEKAASVDVYLSVSDDAQYIDGVGGVPALQKLTVPYFDLALYGLDKFYFSSENYSSGTLGEGTAETAKDKVTMLHLILYATEIYYCGLGPEEAGKGYLYDEGMLGTDDLTITGSPGSLYMQKFWGMDENLNYYLNYKYPEASKGWGSTADQILLRENDVVTIGHFSSWNFWSDPDNVFNYIKCGDKTVTATATQGEKVNMSAWIAGPGGDFTSTAHRKLTSSPEVYYTAADKLDSGEVTSWTSIGNANAEGDFVVDTSKMAPGEYIIAIPGQYGRDNPDYICSTPGAIRLTVQKPTYDVSVEVPEGTTPKFYAVNEVKNGAVVKGDELKFEKGTVKVPEDITRIMWEADGVIGFSAPVEAGAKLKLVNVSFAATNDAAEKAAATAKVEITDKTGVKATGTGDDTYLLPATEGFTYKLTASEAGYRAVELKDQKPAEGSVNVKFEKKCFTVVAPKGSVVSAGTLAGSFKYTFAEVISKKNDGDTVVYEFAPLSGNAFVRVQRPDDKDAVTYWDWKSSKADGKTVKITKEQLFMNDSGADKFDSNTVYRNFEQYYLDLGDIYMNINNEGYVNLNKGETKGLNMFRNWQVIENFTNAKISLPDFSYEIINIEGNEVVSIKPDANNSAAATLTAENEGTAIVLVTYDAMYSDSTMGKANGSRLSAIWPDRTGVFVVSVGKDGTAIKSNMECNGKVFDAEHSPQFYTGDKGASVSFKPEDGVEVTVNRSTVGKETLSFGEFTKDGVKVAKDGTVTVSGLKTGRHIIRLEKDGVASYQVVTAQETEVKYFDAAGNDMGDNPVFTPGEKITVKIKGLTSPAEKFATKYNFNAQLTYTDEKGNAYKNSSGTSYGRYDFSSQEQVLEVTVPADWTEDKITLNGAIQLGGFGGDAIGGHRKVTYGTDSGMAHGTAPGMVLGTLPELVIYNKAHKHEFVKEVADDKYFAAEADFDHGKAYYKSCSCGKAGTEKFYVGKGYGDEVRGKAFLEIRTYKNFDDYKPAQQDELTNIILNAKTALKAAKSEEEVNKIVTDTKAEMDKVKTSKQLDDELDAAKLAGKKAVAKYKKLSDYKSEQQAEISSIIEEAFVKINAATTPEEIDKIVADAQAKLDKVKTGAEVDAEFAAYKEKAKNEVKNYKNLADYRDAEKKELEKIIDDASSAITVAPTKEIVDSAVTYAKSEMDKVKTSAQLDKEEAEALAAAKVEAKKIVRSYKNPADYRDAQKAELEVIIKAADAAIDVAPNQYAVGKAVQTAKNSMDELKTAAQLDKEEAEALAAAKEAAKAELAKYKEPADYRDAQKAELEDAIKAANEAIDAAATPEEVAKALDEAKASLDKIKTAAQLDKEEAAAKADAEKNNKKDNGVKTGDENAVALLFVLFGAASTTAYTLRRKYNK